MEVPATEEHGLSLPEADEDGEEDAGRTHLQQHCLICLQSNEVHTEENMKNKCGAFVMLSDRLGLDK